MSDKPATSPEGALPRLLLVHSSDEMYGSDRIVVEVVDALTGTGGSTPLASVTVWLPADTGTEAGPLTRELRSRGIEVRHLDLPILRRNLLNPRGMAGLLRRFLRARAELRKERFDMVYCATSACLPMAPLAHGQRTPSIAVHVQEPWGQRERRVLARLARRTTTRLAIAEHVARSTGLPQRTVHVVPNAVPRVRHGREIARRPDVDHCNGTPVYLMASRWAPGKGHRTLLEAWEAAGCPGRLRILGGKPPLGQGVDVPGLVDELVTHQDTVEIIGEVPDIAPWIEAADAVILPTDTAEGFGLVLIEAFRAGKPAIASRDGGPSEVIRPGFDGWLFSNGSSYELAELLRTLRTGDLEPAGKRALQRYEDDYAPENFHRRLRAVLEPALPTPEAAAVAGSSHLRYGGTA